MQIDVQYSPIVYKVLVTPMDFDTRYECVEKFADWYDYYREEGWSHDTAYEYADNEMTGTEFWESEGNDWEGYPYND